jgi:hypothetical protein
MLWEEEAEELELLLWINTRTSVSMKVEQSTFHHGMQFIAVVILPTQMMRPHANAVVNSTWDIRTDQITVPKLQHLKALENLHSLTERWKEMYGPCVNTTPSGKRKREINSVKTGKISSRQLPCNAGASVNLGKFHLSALNMVATAFVTVLFTK